MIIFLLAFSLEETKVQFPLKVPNPNWSDTSCFHHTSKIHPQKTEVVCLRCTGGKMLATHLPWPPVSPLGLFPRKVGDISVAKATEIRKVWGWWNWPLRKEPPLPLPRSSKLSRSHLETERNQKTLNTVGILHDIVNVSVEARMGKGILMVWTQEMPSNHTTQQTHSRFIGKQKPRKMAASARVRSSRALSRRQGLNRISWQWSFPGWPGIGGVMWPDLGAS